jgi:hypothetical protein
LLGSTVGHREDLRVTRVHHDRGRAQRPVGLRDVREHVLGARLNGGVQRQLDVLAVGRGGNRVALDGLPEPVEHHPLLAVGGADNGVVGRLEPREPLAVHPHGPDDLAGELALRVHAPARRHRGHAGEPKLADPARRRQVGVAGQIGEARRAAVEVLEDVVLRDVEDRCELPGHLRRVLHLVGSGDHVDRVLGDR